MNLTPVWDLDVFFEGGSASPQFEAFFNALSEKAKELETALEEWEVRSDEEDEEALSGILSSLADLSSKSGQAGAFIECLMAQNMKDKQASAWDSRYMALSASFADIHTKLEQKLKNMDTAYFENMIRKDHFKELAFVLDEIRKNADERLNEREEMLISSLSTDGYHAWGQLYDKVVSSIEIPVTINGEHSVLSVGQAANLFAHPDRAVRKHVFEQWEKAWKKEEDILAHALNSMAGFRLNVYRSRGWDDVHHEPLKLNRMSKETLDSMWDAINDVKPKLVGVLQRKAELLGLEKLSFYDEGAPLQSGETEKIPYDEGAAFILKHFSRFGKELSSFTKTAFEDRWIEAEDRPGKRPGGFCTEFPESGQSRIFMTYSGTSDNVSTLAHELGHAFHSYAMRDVHPLNRDYAMNVAETASTFAEMIVSDAAVNEASSDQERLSLLEGKVQSIVAFLMNIQARFLFETRFYEERKEGFVSAERLGELMLEAQKEAYGDAFEEYHPLFWASKLHFFITSVPFYNFPYTFGFLFSLGIYGRALESETGFEEKYIELLKDTGSMTVEELAAKHLQEDITSKDFWAKAIRSCEKDIDLFLQLTETK